MLIGRLLQAWRGPQTVVNSVPMDSERFHRVDELYHAALERNGEERSEFLRQACAGDAELRREVESLLEFDSRTDELLEAPAWNHLGSAAATAAMKAPRFAAGDEVGSYKILERLGAGGMGEVYRALDTRLTREVALKVLAPEMESNADWRQRFTREAQAASRLNHPNIVTIYDIGQAVGVHFIAMEYVAGKTLAQSIPAGGMGAGRAIRYAAQIAAALAKAHAAGVIHRDVKPSNIMITAEGAVKVLDFGLAKFDATAAERGADIASSATHTGVILGSAAYMSPEQAAARPVDTRCDVFAWGLVLYEMLSGRRAFQEDSRFSTMAAILHKEAPPLPPETPEGLAEIVKRCLAKDPAGRFQTIGEAAAALDAVATDHPAPSGEGETVSGYRLLAPLREEGSGIVYKAEDTRLERLVALKLLSSRHADQQLLREARTASALDHSNIGTVYEAGETADGRVFIATAFYEGGSLRERIQAGVTVEEAIAFARQAAQGLGKAHQRGIAHGGIHPGCLMLTSDGVVKIVDFGLGMPTDSPYASPEQASSKAASPRSDVWSLGAVLNAMVAGMQAPRSLTAVVQKAMQADAALRYPSAQEMAADLEALESKAGLRIGKGVRWSIAAAAVVLVGAGSWWLVRQRQIHWARDVAMPEIARLADHETNGAAMSLARQAMAYLPNDPAMRDLWNRISADINIETDPPGATVEIKDYLTPGAAWTVLGETPLHKVRFPWGYSRVRIRKAGRETFEFAHQVQGEVSPDLKLKLETAGTWPAGMVKVPVRRMLSAIANARVLPVTDEFYIDRNEVTNQEFQKFVDAGGYRDRRYWKEPFLKEGRALSWEEGSRLFLDTTNEPGPATWEAGRFPTGKGDLPVTGISWYEAAAYAEFAGKSLPTLSHWYAAAYAPIATALIRLSNFDNAGLAAPGKYQGISAGGANDMGGNSKEWCWNASGDKRYIQGGSFRDPPYQFAMPDAQDPFDRSSVNGVRCARYLSEPRAEFLAPMVRTFRDYTQEKPVSDDVFRGFQALYSYEHRDPAGRIDAVDDSSPDWTRQQVSYDGGHGNERMPAVLFLPKHAQPPFQVVVYFPGSGAFLYPDSRRDLVAFYQLDYLIRGGRAVLCPVFEGTYERRLPKAPTGMALRDEYIDWSKEIERSFDYLETRKEVDSREIAFLGFSSGGPPTVRMAAYPMRAKTCLILSNGLPTIPLPPEVDPINFAPRLKVPTLLLNGRYDFTNPLEENQRPLFRLLGAPEKDKKFVILEYAHNVGALPNEMRREVLAWLDKYLGPVK
jgi:serine/threonine protein kinase/dienelactone hydrolase